MSRENGEVTYKDRSSRIAPYFSMEILKDRKAWKNVLHNLNNYRCQRRLLYPGKLSITIDRENKIFQDNVKLKQYLSTNTVLKKVLEYKNLKPKEVNYIHGNTQNK